MNRRGQETGSLQAMLITLVLVALVAGAGYAFISDGLTQYGGTISNESVFTGYQDAFNETNALAEDISNKLGSDDTSLFDIIDVLISGGYSVLKDLILNIPVFFLDIINLSMNAIGLGQFAPYIYTIVLLIVIFSVLAVIMKVRA